MYKVALILKYLRKRRIAWVSLIAVMLCVTMVLVVISVMGGWLATFRESFHGMTGDIIIRGESIVGYPYYEEMIDRIEKLPEVKAASPVIRTFGLVNIGNKIRRPTQVKGLRDDIRQVNNFTASLYRRSDLPPDQSLFSLWPDISYQSHKPAKVQGNVREWPGMIVGSGVIGIARNQKGEIERPSADVQYTTWVRLSLLPVSPYGGLEIKDKTEKEFWIVDDSRTQVYLIDADTVYVPFDVLQQMLNMNQTTYEDIATGKTEIEPGRTNDIQIALKDDADLAATRDKVQGIADQITQARGVSFQFPYKVETWQQTNAKFLAAVENEKLLVTLLFGIISIVAIFLIFCIFYMIVVEKTRDIGIIKSVGASSNGVAGIFLGYGLAIGLVGSGLGLLMGWLIVHYINDLHAGLARLMGVTIFNPEVYVFDKIPNRMNPNEVIVILTIAVIASVIGALIPALRAARMNPVEALRWE